jgi:hypothetical protein
MAVEKTSMPETIIPVMQDSVPADPAPVVDPAPAPSPAPEPKPDPAPAPADPAVPAPEAQLYELPDGRKVDAATLTKEWKDNFLPQFTKTTQELSVLKTPKSSQGDDIPEWQKPDYVPGSYADLIRIAKDEAINELATAAQQEEAQVKAITASVDAKVLELKTKDPSLDENTLFVHANKYGFKDLDAAYTNMKAFGQVAKEAETRVTEGLKKRGADPVAGGSGTITPDGAVDPRNTSTFRSATEFLASLRK